MDEHSYSVAIACPLPGQVLDDLTAAHPGLSVRTVLTCSVRDQSELHGLLRQLQSLGLALVGLRQADGTASDEGIAAAAVPMNVEISLAGVISDLDRDILGGWMAELATGTELLVPGDASEAAEVIVRLDRAGLAIRDVRQT